MNDFDEKDKTQQSSSEHPDYYQPENPQPTTPTEPVVKPQEPQAPPQTPPPYTPPVTPTGTYYTPPKPQEPVMPKTEPINTQPDNSSTYHYSKNDIKQDNTENASGQTNQSSQQAPPQPNSYNPQGSAQTPPPVWNNNNNVPPMADDKKKKNKTVIIIVSVLAVCIVLAVVGILFSVFGSNNNAPQSDEKETTTSSSSAADDTKTQGSASVPTKDSDGNLTVAGIAAQSKESCVGITVYSSQSNAYGSFYGYDYNSGDESSSGDKASTKVGEGSGVLMNEKSGKTYVITCAHVISDGDSYKVTLDNGDELDASLVSYDSQTDIGVLSIDKTGLKIASFADSDDLVVGEQVVAIGCPGGLEFMNSVTSGYISALDRPVSSSIGYNNKCIQTDAAINPGNSGGALFNMQGQVIGINSSKIASTDYEGMGFAVPSSTAIATANSLIKSGYVEGRAKIGVTYNTLSSYQNASAIVSALAEKGFKDCTGAMVINQVNSDSDLASKDVKQYDMIVAINGKTMTSTDVMTSVLSESKPGDTVKLTIARIENNQINTFEVSCKLIESKGDKEVTTNNNSNQ